MHSVSDDLETLPALLRDVPFISSKSNGVLGKEQDGAQVSAAAPTLVFRPPICLSRYPLCAGVFCEFPEA